MAITIGHDVARIRYTNEGQLFLVPIPLEGGPVFRTNHNHFGLTADYSSTLPSLPLIGRSPLVLRVEALLTHGVVLNDYDELAAAEEPEEGDPLPDGISERDTLRAAVALELSLPLPGAAPLRVRAPLPDDLTRPWRRMGLFWDSEL